MPSAKNLFETLFSAPQDIASGLGLALVAGGDEGDRTVTGILPGAELLAVWEQDGTSGLLTDLTSEFTVTAADTINNEGGTATNGDTLVVVYCNRRSA